MDPSLDTTSTNITKEIASGSLLKGSYILAGVCTCCDVLKYDYVLFVTTVLNQLTSSYGELSQTRSLYTGLLRNQGNRSPLS